MTAYFLCGYSDLLTHVFNKNDKEIQVCDSVFINDGGGCTEGLYLTFDLKNP